MEVTLKFNLPEEQEMMQVSVDGYEWRSVVWDLHMYMRNKLKHEDMSEETEAMVADIQQRLFDSVDNGDLTLNP